MDAGLAAVFAAVVAAVGGIIVALVQMRQLRVENREDHATVTRTLDRVLDMVTSTSVKLTSHLDWHVSQQPKEPEDGQVVKRVADRKTSIKRSTTRN